MKTRLVSSLNRCFLDSNIEDFTQLKEETIFKNQLYSFQVLVEAEDLKGMYRMYRFVPKIESEINDYITIKEVVPLPCEMPAPHNHDDGVERIQPGLFPELLRPMKYDGHMNIVPNQARGIYFTVDPKGEISGEFEIKIKIYRVTYEEGLKATDEVLGEETLKLNIKDASLPESDLKVTQWFYADCLADYYNVPVFSEKHWEICENFIKKAVKGGRNMLLTPLLTYSLDTRHYGERTTTQLVDIYKIGNEYKFNFDKLARWLDMAKRCGIKYYEISHLFTQWGAEHAPKVVAMVDNKEQIIFDWNTDSISEEYITFVRALLKNFIKFMKDRGEDKKCYFHISDEPEKEHFERYKEIYNKLKDILKNYPIMDAISDYSFYEQGLISHPVPATVSIEPFIKNNVKNLMAYYCGNHTNGVSNSHFSMPLSRTRYLGVQLFKYDIKGFLHWGYNFYNNQWSYDRIDPYLATDSEGFVPGGDNCMVYPAPDGTADESNRFYALYEAFEDVRAMKYCAKLYSFEETVKAIEEITGEIKFNKCVLDSETMLLIRRKINKMIFDKLGV